MWLEAFLINSTQFDWHSAHLSRDTVITSNYKSTQNVRRFLRKECGDHFKFSRPFMFWVKDGTPKTLGEVADKWLKLTALK